MIARRHVRERAVDVECGAVFEDHTRRLGDLDVLADPPDEQGNRRGRVALGAHRVPESVACTRREDAPLAERVMIALGDAPGIRHGLRLRVG